MRSPLNYLVILVLISPLFSIANCQVELLSNPGFESSLSGGPWFCNVCTGTRSSNAHSGSFSYFATGRTQFWQGPTQSVTGINGGDRYDVTGYVKIIPSSHGAQNVKFTLRYTKPDGSYHYQGVAVQNNIDPGNGWVKVEGSFLAPDLGQTATRFYVEGPVGGVDFHVDSLTLMKSELLSNPGFESSLTSWQCNLCTGSRSSDSQYGSFSYLAASRGHTWEGPKQFISGMIAGHYYSIKGYVKVLANSQGPQSVRFTLKYTKPDGGNVYQGVAWRSNIVPQDGWVKIENDFQAKDIGQTATLFYVEGPDAGVDFQVDSLSLKNIDPTGLWRDAARGRINSSLRKGELKIMVNTNIQSVKIKIEQLEHEFGFGTAVASSVLQTNTKYRDWYMSNFEWAVLENDLKWRQTEWNQGVFTWGAAETAIIMLTAAGKKVRGHTIHWAQTQRNPNWVQSITDSTTLYNVAMKRVRDILGRFNGSLEHWDVNNEMLHNNFFLEKYGNNPQIRYDMFHVARQQDPNAKLFLNDYNVVGSGHKTREYVAQAAEFLAAGAPVDGMGVQSHLSGNPNGAVLVHRLDRLSAAGLPIWVTELDYANADASIRANVLEDALLAFFSHPSVEGVLFWGFWDQRHWRGQDASLVEGPDLIENAAGVMWKRLFHTDWRSSQTYNWQVNNAGSSKSVFYGKYKVTIKTANGNTVLGTKFVDLYKSSGSATVTFNV